MSVSELNPSAGFREELAARGGATAARCYQCATCSSVCQLAPDDGPFPRRQMALAQWGFGDELVSDPAVWLCHQCNDCTVRCPRDAKPGDVMQTVRSLVVEKLAAPSFMGRLVARAGSTWPLLLGVPFLFWVAALYGVNGLQFPAELKGFREIVPHWLIYVVFYPVSGLAALAMLVSGVRFWNMLGSRAARSGSFFGNLIPVLIEIATHKRFGSCEAASSRRWGHFALLWGFVFAAATAGFAVLAETVLKTATPLPLVHPIKLLGNTSAVLLLVGGAIVVYNRLIGGNRTGASTAFDNFFLGLVLLLIVTGVLTEAGRFAFPPALAAWVYIVHLTAAVSLFVTFPYSKFAHFVYRALAMVHERMARPQGV
ncbi:MAG: quinone-interacting membrane-bound oxidoreductase complex subunit QmoC [Deltaproteobacteria bacterium]|nr:quinone-interacting membrane-bound oxidoreductase complex subunit QmoC [Deltaproteobacteria bacterium]